MSYLGELHSVLACYFSNVILAGFVFIWELSRARFQSNCLLLLKLQLAIEFKETTLRTLYVRRRSKNAKGPNISIPLCVLFSSNPDGWCEELSWRAGCVFSGRRTGKAAAYIDKKFRSNLICIRIPFCFICLHSISLSSCCNHVIHVD